MTILGRIPAWRDFFIEPWSCIVTPERLSQATALDTAYRRLKTDCVAWESLAQPPHFEGIRTAEIPAALWLSFKNGMLEHIRAQIAANREQFEKL